MAAALEWAEEEFGHAELGDRRRTRRMVRVAAKTLLAPSGKVSAVFRNDAERQGAYDLLENERVGVDALLAAMGRALALRIQDQPFVFIPVDGSSLTLTDRAGSKGFGFVGTPKHADSINGRGVKLISALGVDPRGVPLGIAAMTYWTRDGLQERSPHARKLEERETRHWISTIDQAIAHVASVAEGPQCWFQLDREADGQDILEHLSKSGHLFTVRGRWNRKVWDPNGNKRHLLDILASKPLRGRYTLRVAEGPGRTARWARMSIRYVDVTLELKARTKKKGRPLQTHVVWVREEGRIPEGEKRIEWLLLTNHPVESTEDACLVIHGYTQRWHIEEFHRTWKRGACNVETMQLHHIDHVKKWATILAAVAIRIERLKYLSRNNPDLPATEELSKYEIDALILLKRQHKKKTERIPSKTPTIAQATLWLAELGGYTGKSSGGPPGSVTIGRGLAYVAPAAALLESLDQAGRLR